MKNRTSGFTLVELMVVVLVVALVVLIATQIPLFTFSSWRRGTERLKMQRDAHYAMIKIQHELRPATFKEASEHPKVSFTEEDEDGYFHKLGIGNDSFYAEKDETSGLFNFVQESKDKEEKLVKGYSDVTFKVMPNANLTEVALTLALVKENVASIILNTAVKPRNK